MKISAKGRYAVTAMFDVTLHAHAGPVSLTAISERQDISLSYLEQLFNRLRKAGLVKSVRGPGGGYLLDKSEDAITIGEIISAVDENIDTTKCRNDDSGCQDGERCLTHTIWNELNQRINDFLNGITLGAIVENQDVLDVLKRQSEKQMTKATKEHQVISVLSLSSGQN
ncbi:Rrf2 family transcriptional regulator [Thorsellia anophelis]|uniref:Transcriptional regulator, BadM/Rrf2 family n=1 Tax=Thorsellia anophelis DSM 18579 TaxID=1123402 RepID=A0A1I0B4P0_9GAMM|nr:Rrf2 family transcriptional regulator [Thorsellia anophelis]SET01332.1 transcriptional regulator, BadM/Rrf2 family [Thorsellia anophelis DSM 18579]